MKKLSTKQLLALVLVVDMVLCGAFILTNVLGQQQKTDRQISESNIQRICELATLECYYAFLNYPLQHLPFRLGRICFENLIKICSNTIAVHSTIPEHSIYDNGSRRVHPWSIIWSSECGRIQDRNILLWSKL